MTSYMPSYSPMAILSDLKKVTRMVGCCIVFKLTTKLMLAF